MELAPGTRVEALKFPFKGIRGTVSHQVGHKYAVELDQMVGGRKVLIWPAKRFKVLVNHV